MNADIIFEAVENSLRHSGDSAAIQIEDRVFVCEIDDLPDEGVKEVGRFEFEGNEVLESDIDDFDGNLYMQDCQPKKHFVVEDCHIVEERLAD